MSGEFDISRVEELRGVLGAAADSPGETIIDLSGVTFLDLDSARELILHSSLSPLGVTFVNPSWQVTASIAACGLGGWSCFGENNSRPASFSTAS